MIRVITLKEARLSGRQLPIGTITEIDLDVSRVWLGRGLAKVYIGEAPTGELPNGSEAGDNLTGDHIVGANDMILTAEEFLLLSAGEQKGTLQKLNIEGDDGNEDKRVALYEAYLGAGDPNATNGTEGDHGTSGGTSETERTEESTAD